ncbi:(ABC) transporter, partial [Perkinsus olseni]
KEWYEPRTATGYIDVKNPKVIPKGTWKWTYLGRPDTVRPLKPKRRFDMADLVNASDIHPRNWRKKASDETWREAKRHWVEWARRRKLVGKAYQIPKEAMTKEEVDARSQIDQAQGLIRDKKEVVHDAVSDLKQQLRRKRERVRSTGRYGRWDNMFTYQRSEDLIDHDFNITCFCLGFCDRGESLRHGKLRSVLRPAFPYDVQPVPSPYDCNPWSQAKSPRSTLPDPRDGEAVGYLVQQAETQEELQASPGT